MLLEIKDLKKRFGKFELECSFNIEEDQVIGLVGRNGAGKSTIFKSILGLTVPDSGTITLFDKQNSVLAADEKRRIGTTFPDSFFSNELTINEIQVILGFFYGEYFEQIRFEDLCKKLELPKNRKLKTFSTGMIAKIKLITAITHQADFLLLDEPTSGLDVIVRKEIIGILQDYLDEKSERSVMISSHISSDLEQLCDRIILVDNGRIILSEETDVLLSNYGILKIKAADYEDIDKEYILAAKKREYGYACLTNEIHYYKENYPNIAIENSSIDEILVIVAEEE